MASREDFESAGGWLFRWRTYLPFAMVAVAGLALIQYPSPNWGKPAHELWEGMSLAVSLCGLAIRVFTVGHAPHGTSGRNTSRQVADTLNTTGAYSVVRNPLYLGNFAIGLGIALRPGLWWLALIYVLSFWLYYERIVFAEEAFLRRRFGARYLAWADATPVFLPRSRGYRKAELPFSLRNALRREYSGLLTLVVVMFVLESAGDLFAVPRRPLDTAWLAGLGITVVACAAVKVLKKGTTLLGVEGR